MADIRTDSDRTPQRISETDSHVRTNVRTKKSDADVDQVTAVDARQAEEQIYTSNGQATTSDRALEALRRRLTAPPLEETICRHQHRPEWLAPVPRSFACDSCADLARTIRSNHGGSPR